MKKFGCVKYVSPERRADPGESGLGLVELIVYMGLLLVAMGSVAGLIFGMFNVNKQVTDSVASAGQAQVAANSLESGVRNATAVSVQSVGSTAQLVLARTATQTANPTYVCQAWYFDSANGGSLRFLQSPTVITVPDSNALKAWVLMVDGVVAPQGTPVFQLVGRRLDVNFTAKRANQTPVVISTSAAVRAETWESAPCF